MNPTPTPPAAVKSVVWVTAEFEALHCWPNAPALVGFLRHLHRHIFHVCIRVNVKHGDRDVEFISLKWALGEAIELLRRQLGVNTSMSCEHMATFFHETLYKQYSIASVEVSEDGENGATLYYA
jgi:hypothetical protein